MRYSDRIILAKETDKKYDPIQGKFIEGTPIRTTYACSLTSMGVDRKKELFGAIDKDVKRVIVRNLYDYDFDYAEINENRYEILSSFKNKQDYCLLVVRA